ncbi:RagB/SusD family nutrient uptake outer membrane protein [Prevotella sp.]|mgnify:CR=1 FL=1|uniref:RagB/SusD family nutrient uptake outer membrane protein n=1 Tax=Prevotella sp. TaxID=59823 RepID=UPI004028190A
MKKILSYGMSLAMMATVSFSATSCIEETVPTNGFTEEQIKGSEKATEALLWGMPAKLNDINMFGDSRGFDWGYGSIMHIRDRQSGDCTRPYAGGYDWFARYEYNLYMGENSIFTQYLWNSYYKYVQSANEMIKAVPDEANVSDAVKGMKGAGYAFRAMLYLDMARCWEYLPTDATSNINADGNDVLHLTVPIIDENSTEESIKNNPRVTREKMAEFILGDLKKAEELIPNLEPSSRTLPHLDCVYGLLARYYMWLEDYPKAYEFASKAINETNTTPITEDQGLSKTSGFNDLSKWMWGIQQVKENSSVQSGILNWTGWMSPETTFGYANAGPYAIIDSKLYSSISKTDWRKKLYSPGTLDKNYEWYQTYAADLENMNITYDKWPSCVAIKFRPANGAVGDPNIGAASAYPLMRVEEMYFIKIEAAAHSDAEEGKEELVDFMKEYRDPSYKCTATSQADIIKEIVLQKRIELWGEGQSFFDIKRLDYAVNNAYKGTNHPTSGQLVTTRRPAWMNWVIVLTEQNNNAALVGWNNPDPTGKY